MKKFDVKGFNYVKFKSKQTNQIKNVVSFRYVKITYLPFN